MEINSGASMLTCNFIYCMYFSVAL